MSGRRWRGFTADEMNAMREDVRRHGPLHSGAVSGLYACPQGHRSTVTRFRSPEGVRRCFFCGEVAEPEGS